MGSATERNKAVDVFVTEFESGQIMDAKQGAEGVPAILHQGEVVER